MLLQSPELQQQCKQHFKNIYTNYKHPQAPKFGCVKLLEILDKYKHKVQDIKIKVKYQVYTEKVMLQQALYIAFSFTDTVEQYNDILSRIKTIQQLRLHITKTYLTQLVKQAFMKDYDINLRENYIVDYGQDAEGFAQELKWEIITIHKQQLFAIHQEITKNYHEQPMASCNKETTNYYENFS